MISKPESAQSTFLTRRLLAVLFLAVVASSGCARFGAVRDASPLGVPGNGPVLSQHAAPASRGGIEIATQYDYSNGPRTGCNTFEVYLRNWNSRPLRFIAVALNGEELTTSGQVGMVKTLGSLDVGGVKVPIDLGELVPDKVIWWQFYPKAVAETGETILLQINFDGAMNYRQELLLTAENGEQIEIVVPRFRPAADMITAVTYSGDLKRMFVQCDSSQDIERVYVNGVETRDMRVLEAPEDGAPHMAAFDAPVRLRQGLPLHVAVKLSGGRWRHALVRVLDGMVLDYRPCDGLSWIAKKRAGLDTDPEVVWLPQDFTCADVKASKKGFHASEVIQARLKVRSKSPKKLAAISYCTAMFPEVWNIYGSIADAAYAKPYRFNYGSSLSRYVEEEEERVEDTRSSVWPRPFLYIPDAFDLRGRLLQGKELELVAWMALSSGAKGVRYHYRMPPTQEGFEGNPDLLDSILAINRVVREQEQWLSPLVPVSKQILDQAATGADREGWIKVTTSWSGDDGMLVFIRNLNYRIRLLDNGRSAGSFAVDTLRGVTVPITLPKWMKHAHVEDFVTGEPIEHERDGAQVEVMVVSLAAYRLLWVGGLRRKGWWFW